MMKKIGVATAIVAASLLVAGCYTGSSLSLADQSGLGATLALTVVGGETSPTPPPAPQPPAGDVCPECNGTGILGDGVISIKCPVCNGTGKKTEGSAVVSVEITDTKVKPTRSARGRWSVTGRRSYTRDYIANHMLKTHGVDPTGYDKEELQTMHDNIHEGYPMMGGPKSSKSSKSSKSYRSSRSSCPGGRCPT